MASEIDRVAKEYIIVVPWRYAIIDLILSGHFFNDVELQRQLVHRLNLHNLREKLSKDHSILINISFGSLRNNGNIFGHILRLMSSTLKTWLWIGTCLRSETLSNDSDSLGQHFHPILGETNCLFGSKHHWNLVCTWIREQSDWNPRAVSIHQPSWRANRWWHKAAQLGAWSLGT